MSEKDAVSVESSMDNVIVPDNTPANDASAWSPDDTGEMENEAKTDESGELINKEETPAEEKFRPEETKIEPETKQREETPIDYKGEFEKVKQTYEKLTNDLQSVLRDPAQFKALLDRPELAHIKNALFGQQTQTKTAQPQKNDIEELQKIFENPDKAFEMMMSKPFEYSSVVKNMVLQGVMREVTSVLEPLQTYVKQMAYQEQLAHNEKTVNDFKTKFLTDDTKSLAEKVLVNGSVEQNAVVQAMQAKNLNLDEAFEFVFRQQLADAKVNRIAESKKRSSVSVPSGRPTPGQKQTLDLRGTIEKAIAGEFNR